MTEAEAKPKVEKAPMFIIGADDRPTDNRTVAIALAFRGELKVGDRAFSGPVLAHEVVVMRHFYEAKAGSGTVVVKGTWPPGLKRERELTHSDLAAEVKRLRETFLTARQGGQIIKSFELYFGAEPAQQLKRIHEVMREQYELWVATLAKAMTRLAEDTRDLHAEVRKSMACELITEREIEDIILLADPSRRGVKELELAEIKLADLQGDAAINKAIAETKQHNLASVKAAAEAAADTEDQASLGEKVADALNANGLDSTKALAIGALIEQYGAAVSDDDLVKVLGSKAKVEQTRKVIAQAKGQQ